MIAVVHAIETLTQNENPLGPKVSVITLAEFQFVMRTET